MSSSSCSPPTSGRNGTTPPTDGPDLASWLSMRLVGVAGQAQATAPADADQACSGLALSPVTAEGATVGALTNVPNSQSHSG